MDLKNIRLIDEDLNVREFQIGTVHDNLITMVNERMQKNHSIKIDTSMWKVAYNGKEFIIKKIPYLMLKTQYKLKKDIKLYCYPSFYANKKASIKTTKKIVTDRTFIGIDTRTSEIYLWYYINEKFIAPLPFGNVYEDGKICMGNNSITKMDYHKEYIKKLDIAHQQLNKSEWQEDLVIDYDQEFCQQYFNIPTTSTEFFMDSIMNHYYGKKIDNSNVIYNLMKGINHGCANLPEEERQVFEFEQDEE